MPRKLNRKSSFKRKNEPWWNIRHVFQRLDMFGKEVPAFNINGEQRVYRIRRCLIRLRCYNCNHIRHYQADVDD